ncbi:MAG: hypothetical protein CO118_05750 [Flavobacteriales bacterium CG_4_9_14_3_um_filter_32_8]|nr:MAG: hypothetical protein CO118_05750 [Flavobacteriales bacterium CG_4_9_14_3_um_filter_32_8]
MNKATKIILSITLILIVLISNPMFGQTNMESIELTSVVNQVELKTEMRKLWEDHITSSTLFYFR